MSEILEVMMVPFRQNEAVILPRNLVEYVLPYAMPLPSSYSHHALVGSLIYQNEKVPVVDVSLLDDKGQVPDSGSRRIVIVSCVSEQEEFSSYAMIADHSPHVLELSTTMIHETAEVTISPFYSRIEIDNLASHQLSVLDLTALEMELFN